MAHCSLHWVIFLNLAAMSAGSLASASSEKIVFNFPAGSLVQGSVQQDNRGNLYATMPFGYAAGVVYELRERGRGWHARRIHVFDGDLDGGHPYAALTPGPTDGTFFGTTTAFGYYAFGTIFSLVQSGRKWTETPLHQFDDLEGAYATSPMVWDNATGTLYGTASQDAAHQCGSVFELDPASQHFAKLYDFQGGLDGCSPGQIWPGPKAGTLFGSTLLGGQNNGGTLFSLTKKGAKWAKSAVYTFEGGSDGANPWDITAPADDGAQTMYGVAGSGGENGLGVVFQISKPGGKWVYKVIYTLTSSDGGSPVSLLLDKQSGVLYGTTAAHGVKNGAVFKLTNSGGQWTESILHNFTGGTKDGETPFARPLLDQRTGILYGTTTYGGKFNGGVVYAVTP